MARADLPVVGGSRYNLVPKIDAQRTVNWYPVSSPDGKKKTYLHPWPGKNRMEAFEEGGVGRASLVFKDYTYFIQGDAVYRMDSSLVVNLISPVGFFNTLEGFAAISANEFQVIFIDSEKCFLWDTNTAIGTDNTPNLPQVGMPAAPLAPLDITNMDGYFILISSSPTIQNRFYISGLNDGASWNVLDYALINSRPTILNGVAVLKRRVFFFGQTKSELWQDAGAADFPFRRDNNLLLEHGVKAIGSISEGFDLLFYLSADEDGVGSVMMVEGITPRPISERWLEEIIQTFTKPEDAFGFVFRINGQIFYQINFTEDDRTFVYNVNTKEWHDLEMLDKSRDIANTHVYFMNKHFITTYNDEYLYEMSPNFLTNGGEKIRKSRTLRVLSEPTYERVTYNRIQVDMLQGVGAINTKPISSYPPNQVPASAGDVDPQIFLSLSTDGGATYNSFGSVSFGKAGNRLIRVIWRSMGGHRDAIFELESYSSVPTYILGGGVDYEIQKE